MVVSFVEICWNCWKRRIRKNIPSPLMFLYRRLDRTREKFQTHPRFDSQRVSSFSPPQNDPPFDFCLNYPRFEPWKDDSRACNETLFLALRVPTRVHYHPQIFVSHFARKRIIITTNRITINPLHYFISSHFWLNLFLVFWFLFYFILIRRSCIRMY